MTKPAPHARQRRGSARAHLGDRVAGLVITVGGVGVLVAVLGICIFLAGSVVPLFRGGTAEPLALVTLEAPGAPAPLAVLADEYATTFAVLRRDGIVEAFHAPSGRLVARESLALSGPVLTAWSFETASGLLAFGYDDGSIQLGRVAFESELVAPPRGAEGWEIGRSEPIEGGAVAERVSADQFRRIRLVAEVRDPVGHGGAGVLLLDYRARAGSEFLVCLREDGSAQYDLVRTIRPLGGGRPRVRLSEYAIPFAPPPGRGLPARLFVAGDGASVFALWSDGYCQRYASPSPAERPIELADSLELLPPGRSLRAAATTLGGLTMLLGDEVGSVHAAFAAVDPAAFTPDGMRLVVSHRLLVAEGAITAFGISARDRSLVVGDERGGVTVLNLTSEKLIARPARSDADPVAMALITPKMDGVMALSAEGMLRQWMLDPGHPEASFKSLFGRVHYEGQARPEFSYQSSSGEDAAEPKLSLVPLIHGTIKATIFSMLIAAPLALLAAIYTSEFVRPSARRVIKPSIEMMASLPSVVLGFIGAFVVAPWVAANLPIVMAAFFVLPIGALTAAYLWQLIPVHRVRGVGYSRKLLLGVLVLLAGVGVASLLGPAAERVLFAPTRADSLVMAGSYAPVAQQEVPAWVGGRTRMSPSLERQLRLEGMYFVDGAVVRPVEPESDAGHAAVVAALAESPLARPSLRSWLDGNFGALWPGWFLVLLPAAALAVAVLDRRLRSMPLLARIDELPRSAAAPAFAIKFAVLLCATFGLALGAAIAISALKLDSRDVIFGAFSTRNTLVVGILMGFAIIPIIYTISEDAMRSVPSHLRTASLGAGATPWQTSLRIVLPVAASGIFSAMMIGLGRAAGETMIVVMATGNTPSTDWNIFSGFRTLSANIAVELPEAVAGSTHYRILFLCGLVLFALTFLVNTTAEIVRQRFRARNASL